MSGKSNDLRVLHGLRGVAALTVLVAHSEPLLGFGFVGNAGSVGVILFFILSGFLMPHVYMNKPATLMRMGEFARNRIARVYPLFALTVLVSGAIYSIQPSFPFKLDTLDIMHHLLLFGDGLTLWTISVEFQFYLAFMGLWLFRSYTSDVWLCVVLLAIIASLMFSGFAEGRIAPGLYMHVFAIGMLAEQVYRRIRLPDLTTSVWNTITVGLLAVYAIGFIFWTRYFGGLGMYEQVWFIGLLAGLIVLLTLRPETPCGRIMSHPVAVTLGHWSFGIYLLHRPTYWAIDRIAGPWLSAYLEFIIGLALTLLLSAIAYQFFERPTRKWIRAPKSA